MQERSKISSVFLQGMKRLNIPVVAAVTGEESIEVCKQYGAYYFEHDNNPLGKKWNYALEKAMDFDWTHLMISGDDDIYFDEILDVYDRFKASKAIGFRKLYFIEPSTQRAITFSYEDTTIKTVGAGRLIKRETISKLLVNNKTLWMPNKNRALDSSMDVILRANRTRITPIDLPDYYVIDVKSSKNIWKFDNLNLLQTSNENIKPASYQEILDRINPIEQELIKQLQ